MSKGDCIKLERALHILDVVMSDDSIKHKGKVIRKRLMELHKLDVSSIKHRAVEKFVERLTFEIVNKPSEFNAEKATPDFLEGATHRQHEILDILKEMTGGAGK